MKTIAFLFQRKGTDEMDVEDFIYDPAAELGWFSTEQARDLLKVAEEQGLVVVEGDIVRTSFNHGSIELPFGFKPTEEVLSTCEPKPLFPEILDVVCTYSGKSRSEIMAKVNKKQDEMNLRIEVALLLVADELGLELSKRDEYIKRIRDDILNR